MKPLGETLTARRAAQWIVLVTMAVTLVGGTLIWLVDHAEFPNLGESYWWALQTVTTVGYGDITPEQTGGRIIGAVLMLQGIAFITVTAAAVSAGLIEQARKRMGNASDETTPATVAQVERIEARLDAIEEALNRSGRLPPD